MQIHPSDSPKPAASKQKGSTVSVAICTTATERGVKKLEVFSEIDGSNP